MWSTALPRVGGYSASVPTRQCPHIQCRPSRAARRMVTRMRCSSWTKGTASLGLCILCLGAFAAAPAPQHDRAYWRAIAKNHYAVPEKESAAALAQELSRLLGSPDPELRDDLAYSILATWTARADVLAPQTLLALADQWSDNLKPGTGETGGDSVLR